jgi:hypothetical protein
MIKKGGDLDMIMFQCYLLYCQKVSSNVDETLKKSPFNGKTLFSHAIQID